MPLAPVALSRLVRAHLQLAALVLFRWQVAPPLVVAVALSRYALAVVTAELAVVLLLLLVRHKWMLVAHRP